jgi:hypothetical protein
VSSSTSSGRVERITLPQRAAHEQVLSETPFDETGTTNDCDLYAALSAGDHANVPMMTRGDRHCLTSITSARPTLAR